MKKLIRSMQSLIWAFEIIICLGVLAVGLLISAFTRYTPMPYEPDVVTTTVGTIENGIDTYGTAAEGGGILEGNRNNPEATPRIELPPEQ